MLNSLIQLPSPKSPITSVEDIFSSSIGLIFSDDIHNQHGNPGSHVIYKSKRFGDLKLDLVDPGGELERRLFAQYLWNAGVLMGEIVSDPTFGSEGEHLRRWDVKGKAVLELGAGTGLAGIISCLAGAKEVVMTDYPAPEILGNIKVNVETNVPESMRSSTTIQGHEWGVITDDFSRAHANGFSIILSADCLWMPWEHLGLVQSMLHFLSYDEGARIWVTAGFHTGRAKLASFFDLVTETGLEVEEIWERDVDGHEREWVKERDGGREDISGRKKWLVVAVLQRKYPTHRTT